MKKKQSGNFEIGKRPIWIQCGWYENRTNYLGATFYHTNQQLGPVKVYARYSEGHQDIGIERELELSWYWFFGHGSYGLRFNYSWNLGSFRMFQKIRAERWAAQRKGIENEEKE